MEKKKDLRFQKNHISIHEAFTSQILKKDFNEITVKELTEIANINRKTFYLHYHSIEDLLKEFELEIAEHIIEVLYKDPNSSKYNSVSDFCRALNNVLNENYELHMRLISSDKYHFFVEKVQELMIEKVLSEWGDKIQMNHNRYKLISFNIANGITSMYRMNYKQKLGFTLDEIAELADKAIDSSSIHFK